MKSYLRDISRTEFAAQPFHFLELNIDRRESISQLHNNLSRANSYSRPNALNFMPAVFSKRMFRCNVDPDQATDESRRRRLNFTGL